MECGVELLYEKVLKTIATWGTEENLMFVIGATQANSFTRIRELIPDHFLLVPGVGAQGGSLKDISEKAMSSNSGILVNVSRDIIYASQGEDFAQAAAIKAKACQSEMAVYLQSF